MDYLVSRIGIFLVIASAGFAVGGGGGCNVGQEGLRCIPPGLNGQSNDECGSGLQCTQPVDCPETYCCPIPPATSTNPNCQPGCNGGAASICAADMDPDACAQAGTPIAPPSGDDGGSE
jgi:hypothetical protein